MSDTKGETTLNLYFTHENYGYLHLSELLENEAMREGVKFFEDECLGISIAGKGDTIIFDDDPEKFTKEFLKAIVQILDEQNSYTYRSADGYDDLKLNLKDGVVTFKDSSSLQIRMPLADVKVSLEEGLQQLEKLRSITS